MRGLAARFTCSEDEVPIAIQRLQDEAQVSFRTLKTAQTEMVEIETARLWSQAERQPTPRLIRGAYPAWAEDQVKALVLSLKRYPGCFIGMAGGRSALVFAARSEDCQIDAGLLLRTALAQVTQGLEEAGFPADESELVMEANSPLSLDAEAGLAVLTLIENLEELDDINKVYHNLELTDELMSQMA